MHVLETQLTRWKCADCGTTFRHYPPGVSPRKHYLPAALYVLCQRYESEPQTTYREVVKTKGLPIRYAGAAAEKSSSDAEKEREETRALSPSTVWRWIGFVASLWPLLRKRGERRQTGADRVELSSWIVPPWKYRSDKRRRTLVQCALSLAVLIGFKNPTDFGTMDSGP